MLIACRTSRQANRRILAAAVRRAEVPTDVSIERAEPVVSWVPWSEYWRPCRDYFEADRCLVHRIVQLKKAWLALMGEPHRRNSQRTFCWRYFALLHQALGIARAEPDRGDPIPVLRRIIAFESFPIHAGGSPGEAAGAFANRNPVYLLGRLLPKPPLPTPRHLPLVLPLDRPTAFYCYRQLRFAKESGPQRGYFSPSSDAFQYLPQVQDASRRTMTLLLQSGIEVAFLAKGFITQPFMELFAAHTDRVFAQIGITTLDRGLWRRFEPRTAPPHMRLAAIEQFVRIGVRTTVRFDPLIPGLTDTDDNLLPVFQALSRVGIRDAAASYIFLRPQFAKRLALQVAPESPLSADLSRWSYQRSADGSGGGRMLSVSDRVLRFAQLQALGESVGIRIRPCRCKNPEITAEACGITGPDGASSPGSPTQTTFGFDGSEPT